MYITPSFRTLHIDDAVRPVRRRILVDRVVHRLQYGVLKRYILNCYMKFQFVMQEWQRWKEKDCAFCITGLQLEQIIMLSSTSETCHAKQLGHVDAGAHFAWQIHVTVEHVTFESPISNTAGLSDMSWPPFPLPPLKLLLFQLLLPQLLLYALQKHRTRINCITNFFKEKNAICHAIFPKKAIFVMHDSNYYECDTFAQHMFPPQLLFPQLLLFQSYPVQKYRTRIAFMHYKSFS